MPDNLYENPIIWGNNPETYQRQVLQDILDNIPNDVESVLDVGCGDGYITNSLPKSLRVVGLDSSREALKYVQRETRIGDIKKLPFPDNSFDLVMANDVLEHLTMEERQQSLRELARVSTKYIIITVPFLEDLNIGATRCERCGCYYHVNHHKHSFEIKELRELFIEYGFNCGQQILSGDIWQKHPSDAVLIKKLLGLEYAEALAPLCPYCDSKKTVRPELLIKINALIDKALNTLYLKEPRLADQCYIRTECISIYSKVNSAFLDKEGFVDSEGSLINLPKEILLTNEIDFRRHDLYQKSYIPKLSRLPYFLSEENIDNKGAIVTINSPIKAGFFCRPQNINKPICLKLIGSVKDEATITANMYDDTKGYNNPKDSIVNGDFELKLEFAEISISTYGILFEIATNSSPIKLTSLTLVNVDNDEITLFNNEKGIGRYQRLPYPGNVYLSLPLYGKYIVQREWMTKYDSLVNNQVVLEHYNFTNISNVLSDSFRELSVELETLCNKYQGLLTDKDILNQKYENLSVYFTSMKERYETLLLNHNDLKQAYKCKDSELQSVKKDYLNLKQLYENSLAQRVKKAILKLGRGTYEPFETFKEKILLYAKPDILNINSNNKQNVNTKKFLMICHDQQIDRRIIQQATALMEEGWLGGIVGLSFDSEDHQDNYLGVSVHRIGLSRIVPDCPVYWDYQNRQRWILWWGRWSGLLNKLNWKYYKFILLAKYKCPSINYPLPFDNAFYEAAKLYPSDLIIAHDLPALKAAAKLANDWGVPLIYDAHELYSEQKVFSSFQKEIMDDYEKEYAKKCQAIITVSSSFAEVIERKNNVKKPNVIMNVSETKFTQPQRSRLLHDKVKLPYDHLLMLYQGGIAHNRNIENLIEGFRLVNEESLHLVLLGPSETKLENKLKKLAGNLLNKRIHFLPAVPQDELLQHTTSADFGVIPYPPCDLNTRYCMPNKMFEYIQASLPILANDLVEVSKVLHEIGGGGMIADLNSPNKIAEAIKAMIIRNLEEDRQKLRKARNKLSWETEKIKYLRIINEVMKEGTNEN
ncbi:hypothetical protein JCM14036_06670 [Desulfotomaculum defluvii]